MKINAGEYEFIIKSTGCIAPPIELIEKVLDFALLSVGDIVQLYHHVYLIPYGGAYLEIGSYKGGSLIIADAARKASHNRIKLAAIDPFVAGVHYVEDFHNEFLRNTAGIEFELFDRRSEDVHHFINGDSLDVLFVDGDHSYNAVRKDYEFYWPKVKTADGVLLAHDFNESQEHQGVVLATLQMFRSHEIAKLKCSNICRIINGPYGVGLNFGKDM